MSDFNRNTDAIGFTPARVDDARVEKARKRRSGMTLVEIMIAMMVLAFGLLGVAALQVRAMTEGSGGQHLSTASSIASNRIEALNGVTWTAPVLADTAGAWTVNTPVSGAAIAGSDAIIYQRAERITWDNALPAAVRIKGIEVRVVWNDGKRQGRQVLLTSARLREVSE